MKHISTIIIMSLALVGCGDAGQKALKGAAQAILEEDNKTAQPQQPVNSQQQPNNNNYSDAANQPPQNGYVEADNGAGDAPQAYVSNEESLPAKPVQQPQQQPQRQANTETVVRYRAQVLTQYGGKVLVRQAPSKNGRKLGFLYDQEEVFVIGETDKCEVINRIEGCWVKVMDSQRLVGYSFGGYLQY